MEIKYLRDMEEQVAEVVDTLNNMEYKSDLSELLPIERNTNEMIRGFKFLGVIYKKRKRGNK